MNVDLLDFVGEDLYFDKPMSPELASLLSAVAESYGTRAAEPLLLKAYFLAPDNFSVLVGLYRFFYYQHRYEDALRVADRVSGGRSGHHPPGDHQVCLAPWSNQSLDRCSKRSTAVSRVTVTSDRNPCPSARRSVKTPALASSDRPSADPSAVHLASHLDAARI
jgi:hypothetical protein